MVRLLIYHRFDSNRFMYHIVDGLWLGRRPGSKNQFDYVLINIIELNN